MKIMARNTFCTWCYALGRWHAVQKLMLIISVTSLSAQSLLGQTFSTDKNHIVSYTARKSGLTSLSGKPKTDVAVSVSYMDRLGRPIQSIAKEASPNGKDIISFNEYDSYGLQSKQYMPYVGTSTNALYVELSTAKTNQASFFNASSDKIADDAMPWSTTTIERSPLKRVLDKNSPGSAWENKRTRYEYTFNTSGDNVLEWEITGNGELKLTSSHYYSANTLSVSIIKDSDWTSGNDHTTRTYTNHLGQTILQRSYKGSETYDTYSVYDEQGNLRFIVPPKAVNELLTGGAASIDDTKVLTSTQTFPSGFAANTTYYYMPGATITLPAGRTFTNGFSLKPYPLNASMVAGLLYINEYDERNRLVSKKVPGAEPVFYVYDNTGRLILSQDGNQRLSDQWTFTKYDQFDRPVLTGIVTDTRSREALQTFVTGEIITGKRYESRGSAKHGYTDVVWPRSIADNDYLVVSYYDDYDFKNSWGSAYDFDNANGINNGPNIAIARGLETGGKIKVLGENTWLKSVKYYDYDLQLIQGVSDPYTGQLEKIYSKYSFTGDLLESKFVHTTDGGKEVAIYERYEYDHAGRLEKQYHSIDDEPEVLLAAYEYNELGELVDKKLHSTNGTDFIQSVDYRYNIKGWLTNINKSDRTNFSGDTDGSTDLFGMELYYNTNPPGLTFPATQTNGNLAGTTWGNGQLPSGATQRSYGYSYDNVNRLTAASYKEKGASAWTVNSGHFDVSGIQYDYNGNITDLQRKSANTTIDNLDYTYEGNQLKSINDQTTSDEGFKDGAELSTEYTYDANGNMISDANKLITSTTYNLLNKPNRITFSNGDYIQYTYDAAGSKLKQEVWISSALADKTEYSSGLIFEDGELSLMSMPQGRIIAEKVADDYNYDYQYFLTDHLGNNRVMFASQTRTYTAGMETEDATEEEAQFLNIASTRHTDAVYNHTSGGNESARLNANDDTIIGPAKGLKVYAGDTVNMEVWAKYASTSGAGQANPTLSIFSAMTAAYGVSSTGETANIYTAFNNQFGSAALISQSSGDTPKAFLNYIFFDANMANPQTGFAAITSSAQTSFEKLELEYIASQEGYLFTYVSNESSLDANVHFDDFVVEHISGASVLQADDYYPFGLPITNNNYTQTGITENRFLYQGKEWQTDLALNLYDFHARQYDPATGQFTSIDPQNQFSSPYLGMGNAPTIAVDPDGELAFLAAFAIGAVINWAANGAEFSWDGLGHAAIGGIAGGLSFGVAQVALGGTFFANGAAALSAQGFGQGALAGALGGAAGGFASSAGNAWLNGASFGGGFKAGGYGAGLGAVTGGIIGGIDGGIRAARTGESDILTGNYTGGDSKTDLLNRSRDYNSGSTQIQGGTVNANDTKLATRANKLLSVQKGQYNIDKLTTAAPNKIGLTESGNFVKFKANGTRKIIGAKTIGVVGKKTSIYVSPYNAIKAPDHVFRAVVGHEVVHAVNRFQIPAGVYNTKSSELAAYQYTYNVMKSAGAHNNLLIKIKNVASQFGNWGDYPAIYGNPLKFLPVK